MTVKELIEHLSKEPPDAQVMILGGFNGGGVPREINVGPTRRRVSEADAEEAADCEGLVDEEVVVIGYGSY